MAPPPGRDATGPIHDPDDPPRTQPERIFRVLAEHRVEYLVIGGVAVQLHGHERTTADVDLVVASGPDNLDRLGAALRDLRAELRGVDAHLLGIDPTDPKQLAEGANFTLNTDAGPLDVWADEAELPGADRWERMRDRSVTASVGSVTIHAVGRDDLIRLKRTASRLPDRDPVKAKQDRDDVDVLTARRADIEELARGRRRER